MLAFVTSAESFVSKKGNKLLSLHVVDAKGHVDKVIVKDDQDTKFTYALSEFLENGKATVVWHSFDFDRKGYCVEIRIV